jgi:hypothetical protein
MPKESETFKASLTFAGALPRKTLHVFRARVRFQGSQNRAMTHSFQAVLGPTGVLARVLATLHLVASIRFTTTLPSIFHRVLHAALTFVGARRRNTTHALQATLTPKGRPLRRFFIVPFRAVLSPSVLLVRVIRHRLRASLSPTVTMLSFLARKLSSSLSFAAHLPRSTQHALGASLRPSGVLGVHTEGMIKRFNATLSPTSGLAPNKTVRQKFLATLDLRFAEPHTLVSTVTHTLGPDTVTLLSQSTPSLTVRVGTDAIIDQTEDGNVTELAPDTIEDGLHDIVEIGFEQKQLPFEDRLTDPQTLVLDELEDDELDSTNIIQRWFRR